MAILNWKKMINSCKCYTLVKGWECIPSSNSIPSKLNMGFNSMLNFLSHLPFFTKWNMSFDEITNKKMSIYDYNL